MSEIEKYYNGEIHVDFEEEYYPTMKERDKDKEIERLNKELQTTANKCKQKENIIKEVREKIEGVRIFGLRSGKTLIATLLNDVLEILDKENKKGER